MNLGSESETVEFKKSTGEHKEALQAISAMLNKHGRGELYFGVRDDGDVIGQDVTDATLRQVTSWMSDKIEPAVFPTVEKLETEEGLQYVRVDFSGLNAPLLGRRPLLHPRGDHEQGAVGLGARRHRHKARAVAQPVGLAAVRQARLRRRRAGGSRVRRARPAGRAR